MRPGGKSQLDGCPVFQTRGPFLDHARPRVWSGAASVLCRPPPHNALKGLGVNHVTDTNPSPHTQLGLTPSKQERGWGHGPPELLSVGDTPDPGPGAVRGRQEAESVRDRRGRLERAGHRAVETSKQAVTESETTGLVSGVPYLTEAAATPPASCWAWETAPARPWSLSL